MHTEREIERQEEDKDFVPVIVKRTDEALRHPDDILEKAITVGIKQQNQAFLSLFISSLAAGLILGFTAMAVAIVENQMLELNSVVSPRLVTAIVYPLGFVLCIMSGAQLFTEHTATAVYPILDHRGSLKKLFRLWLIVIIGNLIGTIVSSVFLFLAEEVINARAGYIEVGRYLVNHDISAIFFSALLAGWLMALGGWLVLGTSSSLSQIVFIYIVTYIIGIGGLHHSITASVQIVTAYLLSNVFRIAQILWFISLMIFGNLVGGTIFVALLNYAHIRKTQKVDDEKNKGNNSE